MQNGTMKIIKKQVKNKKGISHTAATVILIFVSVVAIVTFYAALRTLLENPAVSEKISCLAMQSSKALSIESACYNKTTKDISILIKRSQEEFEMASVSFVLAGETSSESWNCGPGCNNCDILKEGDSKIYYLALSPQMQNQSASISVLANKNCLIDRKENLQNC